MTVPSYNEMYNDVLQVLSEKPELKRKDIYELVSQRLQLTDEDKAETISSGQLLYVNRIGWTLTYLNKAGLIEKFIRATYRITSAGKEALAKQVKIDNDYLDQFEHYRDFATSKKDDHKKTGTAPKQNDTSLEIRQTPDEKLNSAISEIEEKLIEDLLFEIKEQNPYFFESLVVDVIQEIYGGNFEGSHEVTQQSNDGGIDGIIRQDRLGFNNIYIQAKKWDGSVDRTEIQKFAGAMAGVGATNGAFITSSFFTKGAYEYTNKIVATTHIILIDGKELARLMIEYGVGVSTKKIIEIKKVDYDYFHPDV